MPTAATPTGGTGCAVCAEVAANLGTGRVSRRGGDPGRAVRRAPRPLPRPRRRGHGDAGRRLGRDQLVRPPAPPGHGPGRAQPPLPMVVSGGTAGRPAVAQHHLHRLRGGPAHGEGGLPHQLLRARLGLDGPAAGLRRGCALLRQGRGPLRPPPPLPVRPVGGHGQRGADGHGAQRRHAAVRPGPRRRAGGGDGDGVDGDHSRAVRARGPGQGPRVVVAGGRRGAGPGCDPGLAHHPVLRVADAVLGPARPAGRGVGRGGAAAAGGAAGPRPAGGSGARASGRAWTGSAAGAWPAP